MYVCNFRPNGCPTTNNIDVPFLFPTRLMNYFKLTLNHWWNEPLKYDNWNKRNIVCFVSISCISLLEEKKPWTFHGLRLWICRLQRSKPQFHYLFTMEFETKSWGFTFHRHAYFTTVIRLKGWKGCVGIEIGDYFYIICPIHKVSVRRSVAFNRWYSCCQLQAVNKCHPLGALVGPHV